MNRFRTVLYAALLLAVPVGTFSQQSSVYRDQDTDLKEGLELFHKEQYGAAQVRFADYLRRTEGAEATSRVDASFYHAMCAIRLDHDNGEALVERFLEEYPESAKANLARFEMGKVLFTNKKFKRASGWLQQVKPKKLGNEYQPEYLFYSGYCFIVEKNYSKARPLLEQAMNLDGGFREPASYYYYYTLYQEKNYDKALPGFLSLQSSREFGGSCRYYIAQIYYAQEKYGEVIDLAGQLMKNAKPDQQTEMARIVGFSFFRMNRFAEAIPYLEQFRKGARSMSREEHYALGYAYFMNRQREEAVKELTQVSDANDLLTQSANHLLGGILVDLNDKLKARSAFRKAASLTVDKSLQEESLLNYAKLNFDLSISGETLRAFDEFLETFPDSEHRDEVYDYMVKVFMNTRNYQEALVALDKIRNKSPEVRRAYQKIAYYRALELFNNLQYRQAIDLFDKSLEHGSFDQNIKLLCLYWQAEAWFNINGYERAAGTYGDFLEAPGAQRMPEYQMALYGLGYAHFKLANYDQASDWFRRFANGARKQDKLLADAWNRLGDCSFMNRNYWQAVEYYDKAIAMRMDDTGYAAFQKGFSLGLVQKPGQKIDVLNRLIRDYPKSPYTDDALYEIGRSYTDLNQSTDAIQTFKDLIAKYPNSSYVRKSYVQLGLIYYNANRDEEAIEMYKKVVATWPDSQEASDALSGLKTVYIGNNQVDEFLAYSQSTGRSADMSVSQQDSLIYQAAENVYMQGDCDKASRSLEQYLNRFPQGHFVVNAHYYLGDCAYRTNNLDKALSAYSYILSRGKNEFTEVALARAGEVNYQQSNFDRALVLYQQLLQQAEVPSNTLDARVGIMRCSFKLKDYGAGIEASRAVLASASVPVEIAREASYKLGKSLLETGDAATALPVLKGVARDVKNPEGAESKFLVADLLFKQGQPDESEKEILEFLDLNTTHQYWLAKAYILWSDIYISRSDLFQAKATLQILKENYTRQDDGIVTAVDDKLRWIESQNQENK